MKILHRSTIKWVALLVFIIVGEVVTTSLAPMLTGKLFSAIEAKLPETVWVILWVFVVNSVSLELFQSFKCWAIVKTQISSRIVVTKELYELSDRMPSGAQRVQEDIKMYLQNKLTGVSEIAISVLIVLFLVIVNLHNYYLMLSIVIYTAIVVLFAKLFNKSLRTAENSVQETESEFRDELRQTKTMSKFCNVTSANSYANKTRLLFTLFSRSVNNVMYFLPYFALLPFYFDGTMSLGDFMQISRTFTLAVMNTTIVVTLYPTLTVSQACYDRIQELRSKIL